jgi:hypothetical protein
MENGGRIAMLPYSDELPTEDIISRISRNAK